MAFTAETDLPLRIAFWSDTSNSIRNASAFSKQDAPPNFETRWYALARTTPWLDATETRAGLSDLTDSTLNVSPMAIHKTLRPAAARRTLRPIFFASRKS